ncbi:hypothetical protein [Granulicella sp. dw_53]|uniref:hypothetical protein n=1 Tax=Granulicella sp. dw_53 TaxID=2719792 RepID=UPI001BD2A26D|nr:hypothetical protein [Granulicella sp. dw_53]
MLNKEAIQRWMTGFRLWFMGDNLQLLGRMASWQVRSQKKISSLPDVEFRVNSQWGDDGIIDWLIERAGIPLAAQSFVEFGVDTYRQSNTRFLLQNRNWRGLIMDGSPAMATGVSQDNLAWKYDLTVRPAFITRENINSLISSAGFRGEIGLLSIDLDGNDYWVWEAIDAVSPIIYVCEYNAVFGDVYPISTPYNDSFIRTQAHPSNLYFGASIKALCSLAIKKGYRFVGTNSAGNNAFFIREDYAKQFVDDAIQHIQTKPSLFRESRDASGKLNYIGGPERLKHIAALPVVNVETGETIKLGNLARAYSKEWLETMVGTGTD